MRRVFVPKDQIPVIGGSDVHYIRDVLRMKAGDELELLDGQGTVHLAKIQEIEKDKIVCEILESRTLDVERRTLVTIAQGLPKAKKMDFIIQKCTELGAARIIPALSERSVAKGDKLERWRKIAKEAAEQCGRDTIPAIAPLTKFEEVLKLAKEFDLALIPWELEKEKTLKSSLVNLVSSNVERHPSSVLILIGPEGGFSAKEVELAKKAGFSSISLGKRILRTETAGMAVLAAIMYELD